MKRNTGLLSVLVVLMVFLAACGSNTNNEAGKTNTPAAGTNDSASDPAAGNQGSEKAEETSERTIEYLGKTYKVPGKAERIVLAGSIEAHEDALVLDVHPVGAVTNAGQFPERFAAITDKAESIGEKREPNFETILKLKPDVILGTSKFPEETMEQLNKIATTIPVSHIATDWEANMLLLGELTGKQEQAAAEIAKYKADIESAKLAVADKLKGKQVVAIRVRAGEMYMFAPSVFVNPVLYEDLGLDVPATVAASKSQEAISVEQLATMNPDHLFIQFSEEENVDTKTALQDVLDNPIVKAVKAVKENHVYVNIIDPLAEGGPAWSRTQFLKAMLEQLKD